MKDPHDTLRIEGLEATQRYMVEQVQTVYRNQGVSINDKHIETIIRQMLRWVRVETTGDSNLLPNQLIDRIRFQEVNAKVIAEGGEPAASKPEILGVTRASLNTDSFLAKASFQETARVLTESAILGETDYLRGLKENVIIGRLIPARLDLSPEGRALLGIPEPEPPAAAAKEPSAEEILSLMVDFPGADAPDNGLEGHDQAIDLGAEEGEEDGDGEGDEANADDVDDLGETDPIPEAPAASVSEEREDEEEEPDEESLEAAIQAEAESGDEPEEE